MSPIEFLFAETKITTFLHYEERSCSDGVTSEPLYRYCKVFSSRQEEKTPQYWAVVITSETNSAARVSVRGVGAIIGQYGLQKSRIAITEFIDLFEDGKTPNAQTIAEMTAFRSAFCRGQQFFSVIKV
jgi:hypothetical protein